MPEAAALLAPPARRSAGVGLRQPGRFNIFRVCGGGWGYELLDGCGHAMGEPRTGFATIDLAMAEVAAVCLAAAAARVFLLHQPRKMP